MRIVIVGAPDTGKEELAKDLSQVLSCGYDLGLSAAGIPWNTLDRDGYQLGRNADYRVEVKLAVDRVFAVAAYDKQVWHGIYTHTLLDSVAYSTLRLLSFQEKETSQYMADKWVFTTGIIGAMMRDTFKADHIFFLPGGDEEIEEALKATLEISDLEYTVLTDDKLAKVKEVIKWTETS